MNIQCKNCFENYDSDLGLCPHCGYTEGDKATESAHMNPGTIVNSRYHIGRVLGYGGFGVTYLAWDAVLATKVAIKEYLPSEFSTRTEGELKVSVFTDEREDQYYAGLVKFMDEAKRVAKFHDEPGIVGVTNAFMENNTAYMVMELLEGETLKAFLEREGVMSVDAAIGLLTPVIHSLKAVHEAGIIHRDIAPDNIMITETGEVKLIDFGAARYAAAPKKTIIVKPGFSPLEQYQSKKEQGAYTDVFALASVLYFMITGKMPADALERRASLEQGKKDSLIAPSEYVKDISPDIENAILNAMNLQVKDRTRDMETFFAELTGENEVKRKAESIKKIDVLKWPLWAKIAVPVGGVAVITALILFFAGVIGFNSGLQTEISIPDGMVRVPSVVNDDTDTAEERLTDVNLAYMISGKKYSDTIPSDYVLAQDKLSGTVVMKNTVVGVTVSKGVETAYVEDVSLIDEVEATTILEDAGFTVVINTEYSKIVAEGSVISQSEERDTELEVGSTITLTISAGADDSDSESVENTEGTETAENTSVPDFSGMTYEEALTEAEDAGVVLAVTERNYTDEAGADTVLTQNVDAGEEVAIGTVVELTASLGEEYVRTEDVQYQPEEEAVENLEGLDVQIEYEESTTVKEGLVISQSIDAGEKAEPEEEIVLVVSTGAPKFEMPDVVGDTIDNVQNLLNDDGLVVYISYEHDEDLDEGTVLEQSIYGGEEVSAGTEVELTVSTEDEVVYVEDVVGEYADSAEETLTEQGFDVIFSDINGEEVTDTVDANLIVIDMLPNAESGQKEETTIVLTVGDEETIEAVNKVEESEEETETTEESQTEISSYRRCGENLTWRVSNNGTLTISGTGEMYDYYFSVIEPDLAPWINISEMDMEHINFFTIYTSIVIEDGVTSIGDYAFYGSTRCGNDDLVIPDSVTHIGESAFYWSEFSSITIPHSVTSIDEAAFSKCSVDTIYVEGYTEAPEGWDRYWKFGCSATVVWDAGAISNDETVDSQYEYSTEGTCGDDLIWTLDEEGLLTIRGTGEMYNYGYNHDDAAPWYIYAENIISVHIDDGVTSIGMLAFSGCSSLTSVTIPDSVSSIGDSAFAGCSSLVSVNIPDGVTSIENLTFDGCNELTGLVIPDSVTSIGDYAFGCCYSLTSITIPESVITMGARVFDDWSETQTIYIEGYTERPSGWSYDNIFPSSCWDYECDAIIVWGVDSDAETEIEETEEETETVGDTVATNIVDSGECGDNLTWTLDEDGVLTISGTGEMYNYDLGNNDLQPWSSNREDIISVFVNDGVTSIGNHAFYGCSSLTSITIPDGVTSIGEYAFWHCTGLTDVIIPNSLSSIGDYAFYQCPSLTGITIPDGVTDIGDGAFSDCFGLTSITIPDSVTSIGKCAFFRCSSLMSITIPDGVTDIRNGTFEYCYRLENITISDNVTAIRDRAFGFCYSLTSITIPKSVTSMGTRVFSYCGSSQTIYIEGYTEAPSGWNSEWDAECEADIVWGVEEDMAVEVIAEEETEEETENTDVTTDTNIVDSGTCGDNLTWTLDDEGLLIISGTGEMDDYEWSDDANTPWYSYRNSIETVLINRGVTSIGEGAFCNCYKLTTITISDSVTSIGNGAFNECYNLESVSMSNSVTYIGYWAFFDCGSLKDINISDNVMEIGYGAFCDCVSLESVTVPQTVTSMGDSVFFGWDESQTIYIEGYAETPSGWDSEWADFCDAVIIWEADDDM